MPSPFSLLPDTMRMRAVELTPERDWAADSLRAPGAYEWKSPIVRLNRPLNRAGRGR
jgi:hypothetical protein